MPRRRTRPLSGILNINKPKGLTSHDVVDEIRRITGMKKVGHAGTLDPLATGVLLVCVGKATRVTRFLMQSPKTYRAVIRLGISTDTYDAEGRVVRSVPEVKVTREEVEKALEKFRGVIEQVPPMYSAIKIGGKRLYELARQGKEVPRKPRRVEIYRLELLEWDNPFLTVEVECSPGTYIRSLAHDLGEELGCGAHLAKLTRTRSGKFTLEKAVTLEQVREAAAAGKLKSLLHPIDSALEDLPSVTLEPGEEKRFRMGQKVRGQSVEGEPLQGLHRIYAFNGCFLGLAEWDPKANAWQPRMVLT